MLKCQFFWMGLAPLFWALPAMAQEVSPTTPTSPQPQDLRSLPRPATSVSEWQTQIAQAQVRVTQVTVTPTPGGLEVRLDTADNRPLLVDASKFRREGNAFIADLANATLALPGGQPFAAANPTPDITSVQVSETAPGTLQVRVTGNNAPPKTDITLKVGALAYALNPAQVNEDQEVVVTGARPGYNVPNATVGTRTDTPLRDIPQSIQVIPRQLFEDQGANNLGDVLRNSDPAGQGFGRRVFENGLRGLRGFDGSRGDSGALDLTNIEQVEILRGPASVLYGSGAAGGLVNLTYKQPLDRPYYRLEASIGSLNFWRSSVDLSGPLNANRTVLYRLNASVQTSEFGKDFADRKEFAIYPTLSIRFSPKTQLTIETAYTEFTQLPLNGGIPILGTVLRNPLGQIPASLFLGEPDVDREKLWSGYFGYRFQHQINANWTLKNRFQYAFSNFNLQNTFQEALADDNRTALRSSFTNFARDDEYNLQTEITGRIQTGIVSQNLLFGVDFRRFSQRGGPLIAGDPAPPIDIFNPQYGQPLPVVPPTNFDEAFRSYSTGIFAQNLISIGKKFKILLGGRYDWIQYNFDENGAQAFSPRVGLVYQPIQPVSLYANWSRSFEPTDGEDRFGNRFIPIRGEQFEVGVKAEMLRGRLTTTLSAYQITRQNDLIADPDSPPGLDFQIQIGEQRSRGIVFDITGEPLPGLKLFINYALTNAIVTVDPGSGREGSRLPGVPQQTGSLWAIYELQRGAAKGLGFGGGVFVVGDRPGTTSLVDAYLLADAVLYYRRNNWRFQVNFQNLTNRRFIVNQETDTFVEPRPPFTVRGTVSVTF
jgi:iron complex outermembrane recepter protein